MTGRKAGFSTNENQMVPALGFEGRFAQWVDQAFLKNPHKNIEGFCFNLFEPTRCGDTDPRFAVELIGAPRFDENDPDWPCDEIFEAVPRSLSIPLSYSSDDWQICIARMEKLTAGFLKTASRGAQILNRAKGVGIGFVGGDLLIVPSGVNNA